MDVRRVTNNTNSTSSHATSTRNHNSHSRHHHNHHEHRRCRRRDPTGYSGDTGRNDSAPVAGFADLPYDLLAKIAACFDVPNLRAASMVCRSWWEGLRPLRDAMLLFRWGKRFKHGTDGPKGAAEGYVVRRDPVKALDSFVKAAAKGSALAMVDAGLMYWEMGKREEARALYREAAELGHPVGQCNLAISYLEAEQPEPHEAVKWFCRAAASGYPRAQYSLALSLQHGRGVECNLPESAKWYLRAAEGGNPRAMYNVSLCYSLGEGFPPSHHQAEFWLKRAANSGHGKAQLELGTQLLQSGELIKALMYFELATGAGEVAALPMKNEILHVLPHPLRVRALSFADKWRRSHFRHRCS